MDTITHIVLGACAGEAIAGKKLGKKALLIGAFANSIPDLDFSSSFWLSTDKSLLAHRGFTHSFLFVILAAGLMALLFQQWKKKNTSFRFWLWFFAIEMLLHLFIDVFNAYGTGLFEPFSHYRVSFNIIFVADPFYSIWLVIACVMLIILKKTDKRRFYWMSFGLGLSLLYLVYCISNKIKVDMDVREMLQKQGIGYKSYFSTPTPLNNWLWYIVAGDSSGYYIGHYSAFDRKKQMDLRYFPKNDSLLQPIAGSEEVKHLVRFSKGFYTVEKWNDVLVFNDLRFGQMVGWYDPGKHFVFYYFLQNRKDNRWVVQRGRFQDWNGETIRSLIKRIKGN